MSTKINVSKGSMVGIDIGNDTVKIAEVKADGSKLNITALASEQLPAGSISGEAIQNAKEIAAVIKDMLKAGGVTAKKCVIAYTGSNRIMSKVYDVTRSDKDKQVTASVKFEMEKVFPYSAGDTELDWAEIPDAELEQTAMKTYAAAAHRALVQGLLDIVLMSGLTPVAIETSGLAAGRSSVPMTNDDSIVTAVLNMGAANTEMSIFGGTSIISQNYTFDFNGRNLTELVADRLGVDYDEAEKLKKELAYIDIEQIEEFLDKQDDNSGDYEEGEFDTPFDDPDFNPLISETDDEIGEDFSFEEGFDTDFTEGAEDEYLADDSAVQEQTEEEQPAAEVQFDEPKTETAEATAEEFDFNSDGEVSTSEEVLMAMLNTIIDFSREVRIQLEEYYDTTGKIVNKLLITGGTAGIKGLDQLLAKQVGLDCSCVDINKNYIVAAAAADINSIYSVAVGLATRDLVD